MVKMDIVLTLLTSSGLETSLGWLDIKNQLCLYTFEFVWKYECGK